MDFQVQSIDVPKPPGGAPALTRGLAILGTLEREGSLSLKALATKLHFPKASIFRLLATLQESGMVRKNDRSYEALFGLRPLTDKRTLFRQRIEDRLPGLCRSTGCTAEWYEPRRDGMLLLLQAQPETELRVQAKSGFLRRWNEEFEAVARLGYAFSKGAPSHSEGTRLHSYVSDGKSKRLAKSAIAAQFEQARSDRTAFDPAFNSNGVRRYAAAALSRDGELRGVLALAEAYSFDRKDRTAELFTHLTTALSIPTP